MGLGPATFWTTTTDRPIVAWVVSFGEGGSRYHSYSRAHPVAVRLVRGGK